MNKEYSLFDAHFHIIDPRFPIVENDGYIPAPFTCGDYLQHIKGSMFNGGVVVSGSFQAYDQTYLIDALELLGPMYIGVIQLASTVTDNELINLHQVGVRAVRINLMRGGEKQLHNLEVLAKRIFEIVGWHIELYVDSAKLPELSQKLMKLPSICIDHLGLTKHGFNALNKLVKQGAHVKASGFGRVDFDVVTAMKELYSINPECLMFGTDLPSTRSPRPYRDNDIELVTDNFDSEAVKKILYKNAIEFYKLNIV